MEVLSCKNLLKYNINMALLNRAIEHTHKNMNIENE
jgi:hypothetical protein